MNRQASYGQNPMGPHPGSSMSPVPGRHYRAFSNSFGQPYQHSYNPGVAEFTPRRSTPTQEIPPGYSNYADQQVYGYFTEASRLPSPDELTPCTTPVPDPTQARPPPPLPRHNSPSLQLRTPPPHQYYQPPQQTPPQLPPPPTLSHPPRKSRVPDLPKPGRKHHTPRASTSSDTYILPPLPPSPPPAPTTPPPSTLTTPEYRHIFHTLNTLFTHTSYRWLSRHRFRIPLRPSLRPHLHPSDRELTEYVAIIKGLIEAREVPRSAVRDERVNELVSVMEGAAEIRHVAIHVSRKQKSDARVLGFVAAVGEFCWVLGEEAAAGRCAELYEEVEAVVRARKEGSGGVALGGVLAEVGR